LLNPPVVSLRSLNLDPSSRLPWTATTIAMVILFQSSPRADVSVSLSSQADRDDYRLATNRIGIDVETATSNIGLRARGRWYGYSLDRSLAGIRPFSGSEPSAELEGHWLTGAWWLLGRLGFQGSTDAKGGIGGAQLAHAWVLAAGTLTPRLEIGRRPIAESALPLSLGLNAYSVELASAWRSDDLLGELSLRADYWNATTAAGRVDNPARDTIPANGRALASAYLISQGSWFQAGALAKIQGAWANTLLATQTTPEYEYTWYPVCLPLRAWEIGALARVGGHPLDSLEAYLQVQVPLVSWERRRWESLERSFWGTAAWEAKGELAWNMTSTTRVSFTGALFAKPWSNWDPTGAGAYNQVSLSAAFSQML
jgi:hypothetical protein